VAECEARIASWVLIAVILAGLVCFALRRVRQRGRRCPEGKGLYPECLYVITLEADHLRISRPDQTFESIALQDLREVIVETNDSGPLGADVWYHMRSSSIETRCSFPGGATGESNFIQLLQTFPGYNDSALREAMGCTGNKQFVVWRSAV